jgi:hypothetical protein
MRRAETRLPSAPTARRGVWSPLPKLKTTNGLDVQRLGCGGGACEKNGPIALGKRPTPATSHRVRSCLHSGRTPLDFLAGNERRQKGIPTHLKGEGHFPRGEVESDLGITYAIYQ